MMKAADLNLMGCKYHRHEHRRNESSDGVSSFYDIASNVSLSSHKRDVYRETDAQGECSAKTLVHRSENVLALVNDVKAPLTFRQNFISGVPPSTKAQV